MKPMTTRTRVKICGLTREADVDAAVEAGADAVGFVLWPRSPRAVSAERAAALARRLPPFVAPVALLVNAAPDEIARAVAALPNALLQFHGDETAEQCRAAGLEVTLVTPAAIVSAWTVNTLEALPIARRMARLGITVLPYSSVTGFGGGEVQLVHGLTDAASALPAAALVTVTARLPVDGLYAELERMRDRWEPAGIASVTRIGDCWAPSTIQQAVYTGHKWARELDEVSEGLTPRELPMIESRELKVVP